METSSSTTAYTAPALISLAWLALICLYGIAATDCASLSCVMTSNDIARAAGAQAFALQAVSSWSLRPVLGVPRPVAVFDSALALVTGLAPTSGTLHNYLVLSLLLLRVVVGIRSRRGLNRWYVASLQVARVAAALYLHGYACVNVLPELCEYAELFIMPPNVAVLIQTVFVGSLASSLLLVNRPESSHRTQSIVFVLTAVVSAWYVVLGWTEQSWAGSVLFGVAAVSDAYISWRLLRRT